jgi:hypothetical protein
MSEAGPDQAIAGLNFIQAGMRNVLIDRLTVEVSTALERAEIPNVVLKGPAIAGWLYDRSEVRAYGDSDLLISQRDWERATEVLKSLGFTHDVSDMAHPRMESFASDPWYRGDDNVDLHSTLYGIGADPVKTWAVLSSTAVPIEIGGTELKALGLPARTVHIALHAAAHQDGKAVYDMERALERLDENLWREAAAVASRLDALPAFAGGLKLVEGGEELGRRLGVSEARSVRMDLRATGVPLTEGIFELLEAPGIRPKLRVFRAEVAPNAAFMRWWSSLARRGRLGLVAAYLWRPLYLLIHTPRAARVVWRARKSA